MQECAREQDISCETIQESLPFNWNNFLTKLIRWYGPSLRIAIKGLRRRTGKDVILACDPMCGLMFAATARFLRLNHSPMVISMFLLRPWKPNFMEWLRHFFADYGLARVSSVICFSSYEVDRYRREFPRHGDKLLFVPVGCDPTVLDLEFEKRRSALNPPDAYIFSGGTTNRDYRTLATSMSNIPNVKLKICAKKSNYPGSFPNFEFLTDIYGTDYEREILNATIVVVPLFDKCFSSGQLTLLKAMELGKPIVASDVPGVRDYITDGYNGLLVPPGDSGAMSNAISILLSDEEKRKTLGNHARATHQNRFTQKMSVYAIVEQAARIAKKKSESL